MRSRFVTILFPVLASLAFAVPAAHAASGGKIGVIDTQAVLEQSSAGQDVQAQLKAFYDKQHQWAQDERTKLEKEQANYQKNKDVMAKDALKKQEDQMQKDYQDYQQGYQERQQKLQALQRSLMKPLDASLYEVVKTYAEHNGYDLILDKGAVVYNEDATNLTDAILKAFNAAQPHAPKPATSSH